MHLVFIKYIWVEKIFSKNKYILNYDIGPPDSGAMDLERGLSGH